MAILSEDRDLALKAIPELTRVTEYTWSKNVNLMKKKDWYPIEITERI